MLYLFLAIASSAMVSIFMRITGKYVRNNMVMFTANYAVCLALSLLYIGDTRFFTNESGIGITTSSSNRIFAACFRETWMLTG